MLSEVLTNTVTAVTPVTRLDDRVSVGARAIVKRSTAGVITLELRRGDGGDPETYPITVHHDDISVPAGVEVVAKISAIDMLAAGTYPRTYQFRIAAFGGVVVARDINVATSPYSEPGIVGP